MAGRKICLVPSIVRAMTVLELMADAKRGFSLSEISRNLFLPKSSTFVALTRLEERGYIKKDLAQLSQLGGFSGEMRR